MKVAVFDTHRYDQEALEAANVDHGHEIVFFEPRVNSSTAVLARGFRAVCSFVNDRVDEETLGTFRQGGVRYASLAEVYAVADILSLHIPLTPTRGNG